MRLLVSGVAAASHLLSPPRLDFSLDRSPSAKIPRPAAAWEGLAWRSFSAELWLEERSMCPENGSAAL